MAEKPKIIELKERERLRDSRTQATSMSLPLAIHRKLELLAELGQDIGASRADVIGTLIAEAELDEGLEARILAYKKLEVGDVLGSDEPGDRSEDNVISIQMRSPGRPRRGVSAS